MTFMPTCEPNAASEIPVLLKLVLPSTSWLYQVFFESMHEHEISWPVFYTACGVKAFQLCVYTIWLNTYQRSFHNAYHATTSFMQSCLTTLAVHLPQYVRGTSSTTTLPAPMRAPSPTFMAPSSVAPAPIKTFFPTCGCLLPGWYSWLQGYTMVYHRAEPTLAVLPITTPIPWSMTTPGSISAAGWMSTA